MLEAIEKLFIRVVSPFLSAAVALLVFVAAFDFSDVRELFPSWPGLFDILEHPAAFVCLVVCAIFLFLVNLFLSAMSPTRVQLRKQLMEERRKVTSIAENVSFCFEGFLWEQAKRMGFEEHGKSRISLYIFEKTRNRFSCLVRRSYNSQFEKKGRSFFEVEDGCIAKAWESGWHFDNQFPENDKDDAEYQKKKYGLNKSTHSNLTMKSKLIAAKKIVDKSDRPLAVVVVESVKRDAFAEAELREKMEMSAKDCAVLIETWEEHLPTSSIAEGAGL